MHKYKTELKWAIYFTILSLLWMMLERLLGWHAEHIDKHPVYTNIFAVPAIALYVFALLDKRKTDFGGVITYQQGFMCGLAISVIVMILSPVVQILTYYVVTPHYFENAIAYSVSKGNLTQKAAEAYFSLKGYIFQGMVGAIMMGIVTSAIVAFFIKSKKEQA